MNREEHIRRLRTMLMQVAPESELEALGAQPEMEAAGVAERDFDRVVSGLGRLSEVDALESMAPSIHDDEVEALEAIILPRERPVVDIVGGTFSSPPRPWEHLGRDDAKKRIQEAIPSIGRIELPNHPQIPYGGTGFVVGPNLLMTNRHVTEIFATGLGRKNLTFKSGQSAGIDFKQEAHEDSDVEPQVLLVKRIAMIHPFWDMALLEVDGLPEGHPVLSLSTTAVEELNDEDVAIIGYPAQDPRNQIELQNRIFRGLFNVKRLQPGKLKPRESLKSFGHRVPAVTHDASTLGGNSGSAVVHVPTGQVIALHFAGIYLKANYAVPTQELARDARVVDAGVNFAQPTPAATSDWDRYWDSADGPAEAASPQQGDRIGLQAPSTAPSVAVSPALGGQATTWTIPLQVTVSLGTPGMSIAGQVVAGTPAATSAAPLDERLFGRPSTDVVEKAYAKFSTGGLADPVFSWASAMSAADASHVTYKDDPVVDDQVRDKWHLDTCKPFHVGSTHGFVASTQSAILIAFRGTAQFANWITNLRLLSTKRSYGRVHTGFFEAFLSVKQKLEALVQAIGTSRREIVLTGHSLGGALAVIAAAEWLGSLPVSAIYTYGQPAVGNRDMADFMKAEYPERVFRCVNDDDIVPQIPPGYVHFGKLFHFSPKGDVSHESIAMTGAVEDTPTMSTAEFESLQASLQTAQQANTTEGVGLEGFLPSFSDHGMDRYLGQVLKQLR